MNTTHLCVRKYRLTCVLGVKGVPIHPLYLIHRVPDLQVSLFLPLPEVFSHSSSLHTELLVLHKDNKENTVMTISNDNT